MINFHHYRYTGFWLMAMMVASSLGFFCLFKSWIASVDGLKFAVSALGYGLFQATMFIWALSRIASHVERACRKELQTMVINGLDAVGQKVIILTASGKILAFNNGWQQFASDRLWRVGDTISYQALCKHLASDSDDAQAIEASMVSICQKGETQLRPVFVCRNVQDQFWYRAILRGFSVRKDHYLLVVLEDITHHVAARDAQKKEAAESERIALVAERTGNGVVIADEYGKIIWVNTGFSRMFGLSLEQVLGKERDQVAIGPNTDGLTLRQLKSCIAKANSFQGELLNYDQHGKPVWVHIDLQPSYDDDGRLKQFVAVETDITARKTTEDSLRNQQELLITIVENVPAFVFWKDLNSVYVGSNQNFAQLFGLEHASKVAGLTDAQLRLSIKEADSYRALDDRVIETGRAQINLEGTHKKADGQVIHTLMNEVALRDFEGEVIGVLGVCVDVTAIKETQHSLRVAEERWHYAFEGSGDGVWDWNPLTGDMYCSPRLKQLIGLSNLAPHEFVNYWSSQLHPVDAIQAKKQLIKHLRGNIPLYVHEHRVRDVHGEYRWMLGRGKVVARDGKGRALRVVGTYSDIHEQKNLQIELTRTRNLESIGQLASGIAHEINTPIQYVNDNVHFLRDSFTSLQTVISKLVKMAEVSVETKAATEQLIQSEDIDFLREEVPRAIDQSIEGLIQVAHIVGALKDFSHSGSGEKELAQLNSIIETAVMVCRNHWKQVATLHLQLSPELFALPLIRSEIAQVVLNLVINAADAIAEQRQTTGGGQGNIWIKTCMLGERAELRVIDDGPGISAEVQARMFDPFYTTKPVGKGSGQGLAICQSIIVKRHQGEMHCESETGAGTSFIITLPRVRSA
jgi:two-component system NtrC family sensor kinase